MIDEKKIQEAAAGMFNAGSIDECCRTNGF